MKVQLLSEIYSTGDLEERGLIPKGTMMIRVGYDFQGRVVSVFYDSNNRRKNEAINKRKQSQQEMNEVVGLLKKLASNQ